jgi:hypothetical protein
MGDKIRLSLDVSPELNNLLNELASKTGGTKSDVLRKAITLMDVAVDAAANGGKLTIVEPASRPGEPEHTKEIVGLFATRVPSPKSSVYGSVRRHDQDEGGVIGPA